MRLDIKFEKYTFIYFIIVFLILFLIFFIFSFGRKSYSAKVPLEDACTKEAIIELSKIVYKEFGPDLAKDENENFYTRLATAAVVLNNANVSNNTFTEGTTLEDRIYNLSDNKYYGHSNYRDKSFDEVVVANQNQIIYISELVLTGKFNLPSNMIFQASKSIVEQWGNVWDVVYTYDGFDDMNFGYERSLNNTDIWDRTITNTSKEYFRNLADDLELNDYSSFTLDTVCQNNTSSKLKHEIYFYIEVEDNNVFKILEVEHGNTISKLPVPTKDGYIFDGWYYGNGEAFSIDTPITESFNLRAHWTVDHNTDTTPDVDTQQKQKHEIYFYMEVEDNNVFKILEVEHGNTISELPVPTKDGYIFDGWYYGNGEAFSIDTPITETFNLRAHWTVDSSINTTPDVDTEPDQTPDDDLSEEENPQTSDKLYLVLLVGLFSLIVSMYFYQNKINVVDK